MHFFSLFSSDTCIYAKYLVPLHANLSKNVKTVNTTYMKKCIFMLTALVTIGMFSCKENPYIGEPGDSSKIDSVIPILVPDTDGIIVSVDSAIAICNALKAGEQTAEQYKVTGYVTLVRTSAADIPGKYTNINFLIASKPAGSPTLTCYYTNYINNRPFASASDIPAVGTKLTVQGPLMNYGGTPEVQNGFIVRIDEVPAK